MDSLSVCISRSALKGEIAEAIGEIAELTIDQFLDDGLLKEIPVVSWIVRAKKIHSSVSDRILLAKIAKFLLSLHQPDPERTLLIGEIDEDEKTKKEVGDQLLLLLDRIDDMKKPDLLAQCFSYYLSGHLSLEEFSTLGDAIAKCHWTDLKWFFTPVPRANLHPPFQRLYSSGLAQIKLVSPIQAQYSMAQTNLEFEISETGNLLQDVIWRRMHCRPDSKARVERNLSKSARFQM